MKPPKIKRIILVSLKTFYFLVVSRISRAWRLVSRVVSSGFERFQGNAGFSSHNEEVEKFGGHFGICVGRSASAYTFFILQLTNCIATHCATPRLNVSLDSIFYMSLE